MPGGRAATKAAAAQRRPWRASAAQAVSYESSPVHTNHLASSRHELPRCAPAWLTPLLALTRVSSDAEAAAVGARDSPRQPRPSQPAGSPADAALAALKAALVETDAACARAKVLSGRAAQQDASARALEQDLGFLFLEERKRLATDADEAAALAGSDGAELAHACERARYRLSAVLLGSGPGGDLRGLLAPPPPGRFVVMMLGSATPLQLQRPEARLKLREDYYAFRDRTNPLHCLFPSLLLALRAHPPRAADLPRDLPPGAARLILPLALQLYWAWLLWFYASLALRENVLRVNGSAIRSWWVRHHYYSVGLMLSALTLPTEASGAPFSPAAGAFTGRYLLWAAAQGAVMFLQNSYQRKRTYTRIALGRGSAMDVASGAPGTASQLRLLFPLLFALQLAQMHNGLVVLRVAAASLAASLAQEVGPPLEWQAFTCGALLVVTGAGSFAATVTSLAEKGRKARAAREETARGRKSE